MKKILLSMFAMLAIGSTAYGEDQLKVENVYLSTSGTTDFVVFFDQDVKSSVSGVNFSIKLPAGVEFVTNSSGPEYKLGTTFDSTPTLNIENGVLLVAMGSDNPIKGSQGTLIAFKIKPSSSFNANVGDVLTGGQIYNASESKNGKVELNDFDFSIKVTNRVVLDENSPFTPTATGTQNVLVKRTFNAGKWSTLFLPFSVYDISDLNTALKDNSVKYAQFSGWDSEEDPTNGININFTSVTDYLIAETPYLICTSSTIDEFSLDNVDFGAIDGFSSNPISINNNNISSGKSPFIKYAKGTMTGVSNLHAMEANELFLQNNSFYYSIAGQNIKGLRATFKFVDPNGVIYLISNGAGARGTFTVDGNPIDDNTTAIRNRYITENKRVYSVTGRFMGENVDMKSLPKGVYIVDGVKIIND